MLTGLEGAPLAPETYAVASTETTGRNMDEVMVRIADEARKMGADTVVLMDFEAVTARWATFHDGGLEGDQVHHQQTVETASSTVSVTATGLRNPEVCLGLSLSCDAPPTADTCPVRVDRVVLGGPAEAAGIHPGNRISSIDGVLVTHPWDVHQRADRGGGDAVTLQVVSAEEEMTAELVPVDCASLYPTEG